MKPAQGQVARAFCLWSSLFTLVMSLVLASTSQAQLPPQLVNTKIVFGTTRYGPTGVGEIVVMNPDGTGLTRLTTNTWNDGFPSWSPDRAKIAYASDPNQNSNYQIFVINADGSGQTQITTNTGQNLAPAWSPDGTKIAFESNRDGNWEIYVINANGTGQTRLTNNSLSDFTPQWSPDGTKIAFNSDRDGDDEIFVMNADGTNQTQLTFNSTSDVTPFWSPDGTQIAFQSNRDGDTEIFKMNADGTGQTQLTFNTVTDAHPSWSPDGTMITFASNRDGNDEIYRMDANGANQTRLTNDPASDAGPSWSPFTPSQLTPGKPCGEPGTNISVPLTLVKPTGVKVGGIQFKVVLGDTTRVRFQSVSNVIAGFTATTNGRQDTLSVVFSSTTGAVVSSDTTVIGQIVYRPESFTFFGSTFPIQVKQIVTSDSSGIGLFTNGVDGAVLVAKRGDVNYDGKVDIRDIIPIVDYILGRRPMPTPGTVAFCAADANGDGSINVADIIYQVDRILNHSGTKVIADGPTAPVAVSLGEVQTLASGQLAIPVTMQTDGTLAAVQAVFQFNPSQLQIGTPQLVGRADGMTLASHVTDGTLRLVMYSVTGQGIAAGSGTTLLIPVTVLGGSNTAPILTLSQVMLANRQAQTVPVMLGTSTVKVAALPGAFALKPNRPNPFNPTTRIAYDVPQATHVTLAVYNLLGQEVVRLVDAQQAPGRYLVTWDGRNASRLGVASGVYLYRMTTSTGFSQTRRMTLVK